MNCEGLKAKWGVNIFFYIDRLELEQPCLVEQNLLGEYGHYLDALDNFALNSHFLQGNLVRQTRSILNGIQYLDNLVFNRGGK